MSFLIFLVMAVVGGTQSLIDGSYEYYHYLQDRFDDNVSSFSGSFILLAVSVEQKIMICTNYLKIFPYLIGIENIFITTP